MSKKKDSGFMSINEVRELESPAPAKRCIVNVATGPFVKGQQRLLASPHLHADTMVWTDEFPPGAPIHQDKPYAFKAFALMAAAKKGYTTLLWLDACMKPLQSLNPIWERIERDGYWIAANGGFDNWMWTGASAYEALGVSEEENKLIRHVVGGSFGVDLTTKIGKTFLDELFRLAQTNAMCGPWSNDALEAHPNPLVKGHRHDQTVMSVIAHRLGCTLTEWPDPVAYAGPGEPDPRTILSADGQY